VADPNVARYHAFADTVLLGGQVAAAERLGDHEAKVTDGAAANHAA
jgi:hypothetical protein